MVGITGVTGEIGRRVAYHLSEMGLSQRLIARDPQRVPKLPGAEVFQISSYGDAVAMGRALRNVKTLFLVSAQELVGIVAQSMENGMPVPKYDRVQEHVAAVAAASAIGVEHIVYLSFLNAEPDATFILARDHFHTEEYIRSTGLNFTFLRQSLYMDKVPHVVTSEDVIRAPAGDGRASWVARDDVADAVAAVLTGSGHEGCTYDITGPEALTMAETAERFSNVVGRRIRYEMQSPHEARLKRNTSRIIDMEARRRAITGQGLTDFEVECMVSHFLQIATGELSCVSDAIPRLCGHAAQTLADYLDRHPESWSHLRSQGRK